MKKLECNSYLNDAFVHSPCSSVPLSSSRGTRRKKRKKAEKVRRKKEKEK